MCEVRAERMHGTSNIDMGGEKIYDLEAKKYSL